jgi:alkylation response protein AidB-like acyl-CoA dehydrogenase
MTIGNLLYSEDEEQLRASVRALLEDHAPWPAVLARTETDQLVDTKLWRRVAADLGCAGLPVPETAGGVGASWREMAVVAEELGRAVAPVPFLGHAIATALLMELSAPELGPVAAGELTAAVLVGAGTLPQGRFPELHVAAGRVSGTVATVGDVTAADLLLVLAGDTLYAVESTAPGLEIRPVPSLDMTRPVADVALDGVSGRALASGPEVVDAVRRSLQIGSVVLAAEQLGLAQRCLELTVDYLRTRRQFGRPIGEFQALKHRAADVWVRISQLRAVSRYAAECAANGLADLPVAAAMAQAHATGTAQHAAQECLQLHGGIGFTWELPVHLYLKRAKSAAIWLGTADQHRLALGDLLGIPSAGAA